MTALDVATVCAAIAMFVFVMLLLAGLAQWARHDRYDVRREDD